MDHAAVALAVAAGDQRGALGQFVLAHLAVEHQLVECRLHHRHGGRQFLQVDEPAAGVVRRRQEGGRRPAGAPVRIAPRDAAQVHRIEQQRAYVDIAARALGGGLLRERALGAARRAPQDAGLARLDQQRQGRRKLAQRVVGGNGVGHRQPPDWRKCGAGSLRAPGRSPKPPRPFPHRAGGACAGAPGGGPAQDGNVRSGADRIRRGLRGRQPGKRRSVPEALADGRMSGFRARRVETGLRTGYGLHRRVRCGRAGAAHAWNSGREDEVMTRMPGDIGMHDLRLSGRSASRARELVVPPPPSPSRVRARG